MSVDKIKKIIKKNNGIISSREISENNIDSWYLTDMVRKGYIERVNRGVYFDPDFDNYDELYFFQLQNKVCIYSYQTALYLHNLTDRLPFIEEVTVYQGYNAWRIKDRVKVHQIKKEWYKIGITEVKTEMGNLVYSYDMERTMCDLVRDRKNQDSEIFSKAWHYYMKNKSKNIWKLREYAEIFNISDKIEDILEVISYE
ncbi:MAG: type IV toxin-antitoxin system AbiEi family antitoxin domain-containing protein [Anaerococcus sp.]|uniref:type IV toxin-antitoxin system AbiEi family antitoxin domain-containing protein n=1 Tax=Anaerococcus sp. TaxID=1872515 RepID=UPI00261885B6|nr:type IV toxin-antitoxin system AbiEi family antitoxin domain-containing protein [Anaerococcus sp.]MCI5972749.1 type IV toxin-antitoxin system AbiEi family antitoxin domain-containing protein [Anaerococcus sp.]MDD6918940.1 type IV toxin-antitoxin system AbiEi family antitoxin domain-containing protein [Peptoniphilaceae bacterium]